MFVGRQVGRSWVIPCLLLHSLFFSLLPFPYLLAQLQSVAKLVTHSAKFWNFLDERRTTATKNNVCQIFPRPPQSILITLSGTMVISCLVNIVQGGGGGGGGVLPRFGMLENSPKTVKCVITFETDCSLNQRRSDWDEAGL